MIEVLEEGETIADELAKPVSSFVVHPRIAGVYFDEPTGECSVFCEDGSILEFEGITRGKYDALIYAPRPGEVLQQWVDEGSR